MFTAWKNIGYSADYIWKKIFTFENDCALNNCINTSNYGNVLQYIVYCYWHLSHSLPILHDPQKKVCKELLNMYIVLSKLLKTT